MVDQVLIAIAAAVAGKAVEPMTEHAVSALRGLRKAVIERFRDDPQARGALEAAQIDNEDDEAVEALAGHLDSAAASDPAIGRLTDALRPHFGAADGGVVNTVQGDVSGSVVQARDIHGGVRFDRP
ncbi:hypothetical protein [Streptomonospora wellingtoniae]|uniref:RHIM domain-containing protein n=1 Tax=Streptomonospora wellingtoniae TaxID=3075544 RepID=A0ABU2KSS1_9ACTN|nr:hypothetical protein [Streptomonospora sp. DSM 45055]MDT0302334.1 hypothetical protein [Streptomonospora sp. DSM 45055]